MKCKDCRHWGQNKAAVSQIVAICQRGVAAPPMDFTETRHYAILESRGCSGTLTYSAFGCVYFEERSRPPFAHLGNGAVYYQKDGDVELICRFFRPCCVDVGDEKRATALVNWLNKHWESHA